MPDDAPQAGQIVWREPDYGYGYRTYSVPGDPCFKESDSEPGVWYSLDPKALQATREALRFACLDLITKSNYNIADAVMVCLGLTPPEPKEGGAS